MRRILLAAAGGALLIVGFGANAQDKPPSPFNAVTGLLQKVTDTPSGWSRNMDGSYKHPESGVLCPTYFKTFRFESITGPSDDAPNIVGNCHYRDGEGRSASIRIRTYVEGWGSDESTAANDKALMATDGSAPPMLMRASVDHKTAASRLTVTTMRNGYLIDCSVAQIEHNIPRGDFPLYCTTIP